MTAVETAEITDIKNRHPCFSDGANMNNGRIHLPVSPVCNIQCKFCKRDFNKWERRPGVAARMLHPKEAPALVGKALEICPSITVAGIAGPGDTLATTHALEAFNLVHKEFPYLINCLSTNGLLLEKYAVDLWKAGVKTVTVTVNAVDAGILAKICSRVFLDGNVYEGEEGAEILIDAQRRGIEKMSALGAVVKINTVLIPGINDYHIEEIAGTVKAWGASIMNIIPLIPQFEMANVQPPDCQALSKAREEAEEYLPVFRHCRHCRADAAGTMTEDFSHLLHEYSGMENTFSHG
ncbi:MAG: radical SAM protein [Treponema sp.]|jgi:nitrogen fixation protein NifB|nr:radical SAM protein [Treponema sp.]